MYYCYAEKREAGFFGSWQTRIIAFDTLRRYLYYSAALPPDTALSEAPKEPSRYETLLRSSPQPPPAAAAGSPSGASAGAVAGGANGFSQDSGEASTSLPMTPRSGSGAPFTTITAMLHSPAQSHSPTSHLTPQPQSLLQGTPYWGSSDTPSPPFTPLGNPESEVDKGIELLRRQLHGVRWRAKVKLEAVLPVSRKQEMTAINKNALLMDLRGSPRVLASGEAPAPGPLLCSTADLKGGMERCTSSNKDFIHDRYLLLELYRSLNEQFAMLERGRQSALARGASSRSLQQQVGTITSPKVSSPGGTSFKALDSVVIEGGSEFQLRFRSEYDYHRFLYVALTVLGFDRLAIRPFCGFPPYDPRNQLALAPLPVDAWYHFRRMETEMIYAMIHGYVVGTPGVPPDPAHEVKCPLTTMDDIYLCLTFDCVMVLKKNGSIPLWSRWEHVEQFRYQPNGPTPYVAFLTMGDATADIVFVPTDTGGRASRFHAEAEVRRIHHITHDCCFRSMEARRVIDIELAEPPTPQTFIYSIRETSRHLTIDLYALRERCPRTAELFSAPWREVQRISASLGREGDAALPIYENGNPEIFALPLSKNAYEEITAHMQRQRRRRSSGIVSLSAVEIANILESSRSCVSTGTGTGVSRDLSRSQRRPPRAEGGGSSLSSAAGVVHGAGSSSVSLGGEEAVEGEDPQARRGSTARRVSAGAAVTPHHDHREHQRPPPLHLERGDAGDERSDEENTSPDGPPPTRRPTVSHRDTTVARLDHLLEPSNTQPFHSIDGVNSPVEWSRPPFREEQQQMGDEPYRPFLNRYGRHSHDSNSESDSDGLGADNDEFDEDEDDYFQDSSSGGGELRHAPTCAVYGEAAHYFSADRLLANSLGSGSEVAVSSPFRDDHIVLDMTIPPAVNDAKTESSSAGAGKSECGSYD